MLFRSPRKSVSTSSQSFLSGNLEIIKYATWLAAEYPKALSKAIAQARYEEQESLRDSSTGDPSWGGLTDSLSVTYNPDDASFVYGVTDENHQKAKDLEYGVPDKSAPSPLLRSFAKSRETDLGKRISTLVDNDLKGRYK